MSIVTLNKYLLSGRRTPSPTVETPTYLDLVSQTIAAIRHSVLCGETFVDLFEEMDSIRKDLLIEKGRETSAECATKIETVLSTYQDRLRKAERDSASDFRNILDMLNETLGCLTTGNDENQERLKRLEGSLATAARMDDVVALRKYLLTILQSVREHGRQDNERSQEVIDRLGRQIQQVHKAQARFSGELPGRSSALQYLRRIQVSAGQPSNLHIAVFLADSLKMIRQRHGKEVAATILQELGRKQIKTLVPDAEVFCWSPNSIALIWRHADDTWPAANIASRLPMLCEQRAFVGTRVAMFNLTLRSLVAQVRDSVEDVESTLDRFLGRSETC